MLSLCISTSAIAARTPVQSYAAGAFSVTNNDFATAARYFDAALAAAPDDVVLRRRAFEVALAAGDFERAVNLAGRIAANDTNQSTVNLVLVASAIKQQDWAEASERLARMSDAGLDALVVPMLKAWVAIAQHKSQTAEQQLAVLDRTPSFREYRLQQLAWMEAVAGRYSQSRDAFGALLGDGSNGGARDRLAAAFVAQKLGDNARALRWLANDTVERGSRDVVMARQALLAGRPLSLPISSVREGVAWMLTLIGADLARSNVTAQSVIYAHIGSWLERDNRDLQVILADTLLQAGQKEQALRVIERAGQQSDIFDKTQLISHASILEALDRESEAQALLQKALAAHPDRWDIWYALGDIYRNEEKFELAIQAYDKAVAGAGPATAADWRLYFARGIALERAKRWDRAEPDLRLALSYRPDDPTVLNYLGYSLIEQGRSFEQAIGMIQRAVDLRPADGFIIDSLGWAYYTAGNYAKAVEFLEQAVATQPGDPTLNEHLGDVYWRLGLALNARQRWQATLDSEPDADQKARVSDKVQFGLTDPVVKGK